MSAKWESLLNPNRRKDGAGYNGKNLEKNVPEDHRTGIERDFDRILFSAPVRRLDDKTQVFPLEKNDSVRNRLTHSHEVSNLCRSIGNALVYKHRALFENAENIERNIPSVLAAAGLAHDLGNPPFGHQGEVAICDWFHKNKGILKGVLKKQKNDFLKFEGNAQTIRLLLRLQQPNDSRGLNLTYATIATLVKYPYLSYRKKKKYGYFFSEKDIMEEVWQATELQNEKRHPLSFIMEAADDIAYSVIDIEDAVKKNIVSIEDIIAYLENCIETDKEDYEEPKIKVFEDIRGKTENMHKEHRKLKLSYQELSEVSTQMFRVYAIGAMVTCVIKAFKTHYEDIMTGSLGEKEPGKPFDLLDKSDAGLLRDKLKDFAYERAYKHRSVLKLEIMGHGVITGLMDYFWKPIQKIEKNLQTGKKIYDDLDPFEQYTYKRIAENYRREFENTNNGKPKRYNSLQLITDMVSGMTDSYAISVYKELKKLDEQFSHK